MDSILCTLEAWFRLVLLSWLLCEGMYFCFVCKYMARTGVCILSPYLPQLVLCMHSTLWTFFSHRIHFHFLRWLNIQRLIILVLCCKLYILVVSKQDQDAVVKLYPYLLTMYMDWKLEDGQHLNNCRFNATILHSYPPWHM